TAPAGCSCWQRVTQAASVHGSAQAMNLPHGEVVLPHAMPSLTHWLPGATAASVHSPHVKEAGVASMKAWTSAAAGPARTLTPICVQSCSPKDVTPATRGPPDVGTMAGPPESPAHAPLRSVWS